MAPIGQLPASTAAAAFGAPSERRRLHAASAGSAASLFVNSLIIALLSPAAQGSCTRSLGPSAACFVQAGGAAATSETGGRQPQGPRTAWGCRVPLAASGGAACCWLSRRPPPPPPPADAATAPKTSSEACCTVCCSFLATASARWLSLLRCCAHCCRCCGHQRRRIIELLGKGETRLTNGGLASDSVGR